MLVEALIRDLNRKHGCKVTEASKELLDQLARHNWPGNVRELRNVIERAVIIAGEGPMTPAHLPHFHATAGPRPAVGFQRTGCGPSAGRHDGVRSRKGADPDDAAAHEEQQDAGRGNSRYQLENTVQ